MVGFLLLNADCHVGLGAIYGPLFDYKNRYHRVRLENKKMYGMYIAELKFEGVKENSREMKRSLVMYVYQTHWRLEQVPPLEHLGILETVVSDLPYI